MTNVRLSGWILLLAVLGLIPLACGDDDSTTPTAPTMTDHYDAAQGWVCSSSESCQDVFNIKFASGTTVAFEAIDVTGSSIVQLALYAPGVPLGDTNLFTGTNDEYRCNYIDGCDTMPQGQSVNFVVSAEGTYRLAVTRDWGESCGGDGTYRLVITSDREFTTPVRAINDGASLAPGAGCP